MPWNETDRMNERVKFIARYLENDDDFKALCERTGISRKTGYKWVERYDHGGVAGGLSRLAVWWIRLGIRPERIGYATPASRYVPSPRAYPRQLPQLEYPAHFRVERAYPNGVISFRETQWYLSNLPGWRTRRPGRSRRRPLEGLFRTVELGVLDVRNAKIRGYRQFGLLVRTDGTIVSRRRRRTRR
jgi:hypothetical protein